LLSESGDVLGGIELNDEATLWLSTRECHLSTGRRRLSRTVVMCSNLRPLYK
jgi:gluconate kinase